MLIFAGNPPPLAVHHELWHLIDFRRSYRSDKDLWDTLPDSVVETFVHQRLTGKPRRWQGYSDRERAIQERYIQEVLASGD